MKATTREEFESMALTLGDYWRKSWRGRWLYTEVAGKFAMEDNPTAACEVGSDGIGCLAGSTKLDFDLCATPYPIETDAFDVFVALQVWEHLGGFQAAAFAEAMRISRKVILSVPYLWSGVDQVHDDINFDTIIRWAGGITPDVSIKVHSRMVCMWKRERQK